MFNKTANGAGETGPTRRPFTSPARPSRARQHVSELPHGSVVFAKADWAWGNDRKRDRPMIVMQDSRGLSRAFVGTTDAKYCDPSRGRDGVWFDDGHLLKHHERSLRRTFFNTREVYEIPDKLRALHVVGVLKECFVKRLEGCIGMQALEPCRDFHLHPFEAVYYRGTPKGMDRGYKRGVVTEIIGEDEVRVVPLVATMSAGPVAYIQFGTTFYVDENHSGIVISTEEVFGTRNLSPARKEALAAVIGTGD